MKNKKPRVLFYDIETTPLKAYIWRLGQQIVRHGQLDKKCNMYKIICITYCWNDGKKAKALVWDGKDSGPIVKEFDKIIKQADLTIGKNSDRFDVKHINTQRMLSQDYGMPEWAQNTDDLEKQIRRHFALPSYSLDYLSELLGLGGKNKMEFSDWVDILEPRTKATYNKALKKMVTYGKKDVEDTRDIWYQLEKHFTPRFNMSTFLKDFCCTTCGSKNIHRNGTKVAGKGLKQRWFCNDHGGHAGYTVLQWKHGHKKLGG